MARQVYLDSPFGDASLSQGALYTSISAKDPLGGDWALGWWHSRSAGERAFRARRFWRGELCGRGKPSAERTELDAFVKRWSFTDGLESEAASMDPTLRARVHAYVQGFNYAKQGRGEAPWSIEDCLLLTRTLGFVEWWETALPLQKFFLNALQSGLPWERLADLFPGLGPPPDRRDWKQLRLPEDLSAGAQALVQQLPCFRGGMAWAVPGQRTSTGRPFLAATYINEFSRFPEIFLPIKRDTPAGPVRGLSWPGHPGLLCARTRTLAWHAAPVVDDSIDWRVLDRAGDGCLSGAWAGAGRGGTLESLLCLEEAVTTEQARERSAERGSAVMDITAVDARGGALVWGVGPIWQRNHPRDRWLPTGLPQNSLRLRSAPTSFSQPPGGRFSLSTLADAITSLRVPDVDRVMAPLRFLLPDHESGQALRRWTGEPGPAAVSYEKVHEELFHCFWEAMPVKPVEGSPEHHGLLEALDRLVQAPHSAWFPSEEKNRRLAEAVRRALAPGRPPGPPILRRQAPRGRWTEVTPESHRTFAVSFALAVDPGETGWRLWQAAEADEEPEFQSW